MAKQKFYTVWKGRVPGVYSSWESCKAQTEGFEGAKFKSFDTQDEAVAAMSGSFWQYATKKASKPKEAGEVIKNSLAVDAACSGNPGDMEYRGVYVATGKEVFKSKVYKQATNNIGEFLAIVHGLALLKQKKLDMPLYSDSATALSWIKAKKCRTKLERNDANAEVFERIAAAEAWLSNNTYTTKIYKWDTPNWGEVPADFGRK